ncbi:MAG: universal stress protein [Opitutaceae bacterium]|nr:universal stress protein [Opitutaceae bacterium]
MKASYPRIARLLVPLDFSGQSRQALRYAVPIAQKFRARIILVHVIQPTYRNAPGVTLLTLDYAKLKQKAERRLADMAARLLSKDLHERNIVRIGTPHTEILWTAGTLKVDMIVLATHGRTGLKRFVLGSTAEQVMRHAECPVLSVRRR